MLGINVNIDDSFLKDLTERIEPGHPEELFNIILEEYFEIEFKSKWKNIMQSDGFEEERKILHQIKHDIINHLLLHACCIDVFKHYKNINDDFIITAPNALENMKVLDCLPRSKTYQNGHLIDKGEKNIFMFPFEIKIPLAFPLYFDKCLAYYLIGMYKSEVSKSNPTYIYKHNLLKNNEYNTKELIVYCTNYHKLSINGDTSILDDYLFEQEFNHILALEISKSINAINDTISDSTRELIEFALSFLSLLPLYTRTSFIKLFLALGENAAPEPFSVLWAKKCIDAVINLSFISIPLMEQCYYHILRRKRQVKESVPVLIRENNRHDFLKLLQELYDTDINHIKTLNSISTLINKDEYCRIQNTTSLLATVFRDDVFDSVCTVRNDRIFVEVFDGKAETHVTINEKKLTIDSIFASINSILNGNLRSCIDEPFSSDTNEKRFFNRRLAASIELGILMDNYINTTLQVI